MALRPEDLPRDPAALIEIVLSYAGKIESLEETIATLKTLIFGVRSERAAVICAEQLALDLGNEKTAAPPPANDDDPASPTARPSAARLGATSALFPLICRAASR